MRLREFTFILILQLSAGASYAGALVGDWWQEDQVSASSGEKIAISQPVSQSTEEIQVTLGIKGPGSTEPVDFFAVISSKNTDDSCLYSVNEVIIDAQAFAVSSPRHRSDIGGIRAATPETQKRLWQAFVKGRKFALKVGQTCSGPEQVAKVTNRFDFSLNGSSAAYRYVAGLKPPEALKQTQSSDATSAPRTGDTETTREAVPNSGFPISLFLTSIVAIFLVLYFLRQRQPAARDHNAWRSSEWPEPKIGDVSRQKAVLDSADKSFRTSRGTEEKPESRNIPPAAIRPDVTSLPRYKVQHVIDGDTVVLSNPRREIRVRLDAIDCPEDGQEWGSIATAGLIKLIGGRQVCLEEHGSDRYERMLATLYVRHDNDAEWMNVNERMVTLGHAWVMRRFYKHLPKERRNKLNQLERWAKSKKVGLWKTNDPVPPWNWRNNQT